MSPAPPRPDGAARPDSRSSGDAEHLRASWNRASARLARWPVEIPGVPRTEEEVSAVLDAAPTGSLELLADRGEPGERMPQLDLPEPPSRVLAPHGAPPFVLRAGDVTRWCAPCREWARAFGAFVRGALAGRMEPLRDVRVDLYLASPGAVSAFHADPSHNFTHQMRGTRRARVFAPDEPAYADPLTREGVFLVRGQFPVYRPEVEPRAVEHRLEPGEVLYLPPCGAHWLVNGEEPSLAYVVSVRTRAEHREKRVHAWNRRAARRGWRRVDPRGEPGRARLAAWLEGCIRALRRSEGAG